MSIIQILSPPIIHSPQQMFKSPMILSNQDRLSQLISNDTDDNDELLSPREREKHYQQEEVSIEENQDYLNFSQHNLTNSGDHPSEIEFSQSFTLSQNRPLGTESIRSRDHSPNSHTVAVSNARLERELALKDQQIKQLTDFMNKKKNEEGSSNQVFEKEMGRLQQDLAKKDILNSQLTRKSSIINKELEELRQICRRSSDELKHLNRTIEASEELKKETDELIVSYHQQLEQKEQLIAILQGDNQRMAELLGDKVGEEKVGRTGKKLYQDQSLHGSGVSSTNLNNLTLKHKQEISKITQQLSLTAQKYQQLKKKFLLKERSFLEQKQLLSKLQSTIQSKTKNIEALTASLNEKNAQIRSTKEKEERMGEMERRIKGLKEESEKKENKISSQASELAEKNKTILGKIKVESELKSRLEMEGQRGRESQKEIEVLNQKIKGNREMINKLERQVEGLKASQMNHRKEQNLLKEAEKQQETLKTESHKSYEKYQRELADKDLLISQIRKRLEEAEKMREKVSSNSVLLEELEGELSSERERCRKLTIELTKKQSELERLQNKTVLLEARVSKSSYINQAAETQQLQDKIRSLEIILKSKNEKIMELQRELQMHSNQIDNEISQDLINYNIKEVVGEGWVPNNDNASNIIACLKRQLMEKYEENNDLKRQNDMKDKGIQFAMEKFLKVEQEKLMLEKNNINLGGRSTLEDSMESDYYARENDVDREYEILLDRCETLEERNRLLESQLREAEEGNRYRSAPSSEFSKTSFNKLEHMKLKNQNEDLKDEINRLIGESKRKNNLDKLGSGELVDLLIEVLKRVYKSSELIKIVLRNPDFLDLIKRITKRQDRESGPVLVSKRSY